MVKLKTIPITNKTCVAGAVLQSPPLLIDSLIKLVILTFRPFKTLSSSIRKSWGAKILKKIFTPHHVSHIRCHISCFMGHVSGVTGQVLCVMCQVSGVNCYFFVKLVGARRFCYQRGIPPSSLSKKIKIKFNSSLLKITHHPFVLILILYYIVGALL